MVVRNWNSFQPLHILGIKVPVESRDKSLVPMTILIPAELHYSWNKFWTGRKIEERNEKKIIWALFSLWEKKNVVRKTFSSNNVWEVVELEQSCGILDNKIPHKELSKKEFAYQRDELIYCWQKWQINLTRYLSKLSLCSLSCLEYVP